MSDPNPSTSSIADAQQRQVQYFGRVQGVGFRYTSRAIAGRFQVTGYVMNLSDGSVRLVTEGRSDELDRFLAAIDAELGRYVTSCDVQTASATGEFREFSIRL